MTSPLTNVLITSPLQNASSETKQPNLIPPEKISLLPQKVFNEIFSCLGKSNLQEAMSLNQSLRSHVQAAVNYNEPASIKKFILVLIEKLNAKEFLFKGIYL